MNPTKTEAIKNFLITMSREDLAKLYSKSMECQVNVAQDGGSRVDGDFKGRRWSGWSDGLTTWKPFRIPLKANSEPEYVDSVINFDLAKHVEAIGMTGWDWEHRCSKWVAFDFDSIIGHATKGLSIEQLDKVVKAAEAIPWITIRKSTSGKGIHLYVFLPDIPTKTHTEHAALARAILGKMSAITGFDFKSKVDGCGGNMWVWHRKMQGTDGLTLLKSGDVLLDIPSNWKDHIGVVTGTRQRNFPHFIPDTNLSDFDTLCSRRTKIPLDEEHKRLLKYFEETNATWWWDQDHHILVTHTSILAEAFSDLHLKGIFKTIAKGSVPGDHNCFCSPLRNGAWSVRRFTPGVSEDESWQQDSAGWTYCFLNRDPNLASVSRAFGGIEDTKNGFIFREAEIALKAAQLLGIAVEIPPFLYGRPAKLKQHKDGRLIIEIEHKDGDPGDMLTQWLPSKGNWTRVFNTIVNTPQEPEVSDYEDLIRHIISPVGDEGWMIKRENTWSSEPITHVKLVLQALGHTAHETSEILGAAIVRCWKLVNKPFQTEYPGNREWNRNAAQLRFLPTQNLDNLQYPTWLKILNHCGKSLNDEITRHDWCKDNGIFTGADYLKCWIASVFQKPEEPLPYLFLHGPQSSGKSIFYEALSLLLTKGCERADVALVNQQGFNAELLGALFVAVEETDLSASKLAYNRIKDWVTGREMLIHPKQQVPYHVTNTTHWIQTANDYTYCPTFPGDTRIIYIYVDMPIENIPKRVLFPLLEKEAPDFLAELLHLDLPTYNGRFDLPVISTMDKIRAMAINETALAKYLEEFCVQCPGSTIQLMEFYDRFVQFLEPLEISKWTKRRVTAELPKHYQYARKHGTGQFHIINIKWKDSANVPGKELVILNGYIEEQ